jgi:hypothetical protein
MRWLFLEATTSLSLIALSSTSSKILCGTAWDDVWDCGHVSMYCSKARCPIHRGNRPSSFKQQRGIQAGGYERYIPLRKWAVGPRAGGPSPKRTRAYTDSKVHLSN